MTDFPPAKKLKQATLTSLFGNRKQKEIAHSEKTGFRSNGLPQGDKLDKEQLLATGACSSTHLSEKEMDAAQNPGGSHEEDQEKLSSHGHSSGKSSKTSKVLVKERGKPLKHIKMASKKTPQSASTDGKDASASPDMFEDEDSKVSWRGAPISGLTKLSEENLNVPDVAVTPSHKVFVRLPLLSGMPPAPWPRLNVDIWDSDHVRMPNSSQSLYPKEQSEGELQSRWSIICAALQRDINSIKDLKQAILSYNHRYSTKWNFEGLQKLVEKEFEEEEREHFFKNSIPSIVRLALSLPSTLTKPLPLLKRQKTQSITLSKQQVACLLANAFFCTYPRRNAKGTEKEYSMYPDINFNRLFNHKEAVALEKMKCILHYFQRITSADTDGLITFTRQCLGREEAIDFEMLPYQLPDLHVDSKGLIEEADGLLQVDFANKFLGGGVLGLGCVQEEIRYALCPELIITRLFTEMLEKNEALIITGVEQFSQYTGYGSHFKWTGPHFDKTPVGLFRRKLCQVVAIDALSFGSRPHSQYSPINVTRELAKAYVGFRPIAGSKGRPTAVATGNWGCGAFKGNPRLKCLIQLVAAAAAGRDLAYFTFGDAKLRDELFELFSFLKGCNTTAGELAMMLRHYGLSRSCVDGKDLFHYMRHNVSPYKCSTDSEETPCSQCFTDEEPMELENAPSNPCFSGEQKGSEITDLSKNRSKITPSQTSSVHGDEVQFSSLSAEMIEEALQQCESLMKSSTQEQTDQEKTSLVEGNQDIASTSQEAVSNEEQVQQLPGESALSAYLDVIDKSLPK